MTLLWFLYQYFSLAVALLYYGYCEFLFWLLRKSEQNMPLRLTTVLNLIAYACVLTQFQPIFSSYFYFTFFLSLCHTHVRIHTHTHTHTHSVICISLLPQIPFFGVVKICTSIFFILTIYKCTIQWH